MTICIQPVYSMGWGRVLRCPPVAGPWLGGLAMHPPTNTILVYIIYRYVLNIYLSLSNDHCALSQAHCWFENKVSFPTTTMPLSLSLSLSVSIVASQDEARPNWCPLQWGWGQQIPSNAGMGVEKMMYIPNPFCCHSY